MKTLIVVLALMLSGCATPPQWLATMYNRNDRCQNFDRDPNYRQPDFCGSGGGKTYVTRDYTSGRYLTVTKAQ